MNAQKQVICTRSAAKAQTEAQRVIGVRFALIRIDAVESAIVAAIKIRWTMPSNP